MAALGASLSVKRAAIILCYRQWGDVVDARKAIRAARSASRHGGAPPLANVRTLPWLDLLPPDPLEVLCHIHQECGRLGVEVDEFPEHHVVLMRDVRAWLSQARPDSVARAVSAAGAGIEGRAPGSPVRVRAALTRQGSLRVGLERSPRPLDRARRPLRPDRRPSLRLVGSRHEVPPPVARAAGGARELIFFRQVARLGGISHGRRPAAELEPLSALLVLLVRSCYEALLKQLRQHMDVELADQFVFDFVKVPQRPFQRLRSWKIVAAQPTAKAQASQDGEPVGGVKVVAFDAIRAR